MAEPSYFRLPAEGADQPVMLWPKDGDFIVQIGRERPWLNHTNPTRFAMIITDLLWMCKPVTKAEWNWAMENGTWQTTK